MLKVITPIKIKFENPIIAFKIKNKTKFNAKNIKGSFLQN